MGTPAADDLWAKVAAAVRAQLSEATWNTWFQGVHALSCTDETLGLVTARFSGVAAHAGLEPGEGASALLEMSRFALYADALADGPSGTSVVPTVSLAPLTTATRHLGCPVAGSHDPICVVSESTAVIPAG